MSQIDRDGDSWKKVRQQRLLSWADILEKLLGKNDGFTCCFEQSILGETVA